MAEAFLQKMNPSLEVFSGGLQPAEETDPLAVKVMEEINMDISSKRPKSYTEFEGMVVDYLITLCDGTKDEIASVNIFAKHRIHLGFEDPKKAYCYDNQIIEIYRDIRDEIKNELDYFYSRILAPELTHG
jgi:arsenate reductase